MAERVLVIGGAGMLGAPVVRALQQRGYSVRVFSRAAPAKAHDGVEAFAGDVVDRARLRPALADCIGAHVSLRGASIEDARWTEVAGAAVVAELCRELGLKLSYLSNAGLDAAPGDNAFANVKRDAEAAIRAAGAD